MKRARIGMIAVAVFAMATMAFAQKPDFSGTWNLDPAASGMGAGAPGGGGRMGGMNAGPMTVTQTADKLTVERSMGENKMTTTYKLDGTESVNQQMGRGGQTTEVRSIAKFDGPKLVITSKRQMNDQTVETTETWTVDGSTLTIESTNARGTQKRVYKK